MTIYRATVSMDLMWDFELEADNEEAAYEELWNLIGYEGEDLVDVPFDLQPETEDFDIYLRIKK